MAWVLGMIKDGDADDLVIDRPVVIAPIGVFAPGLLVFDAGALDNVAFAGFVLAAREAHGLGDANSHGAFLGVAEDEVLIGCFDGDVEIEKAFVIGPCKNAEGAFIGAGGASIGRDPFAGRADDTFGRARFHFFKRLAIDPFDRRRVNPGLAFEQALFFALFDGDD